MKFETMNDIKDFCKVLDACTGKVWVENASGAYFDLTSELSRFVAISEFLKNPDCDLELFAAKREDEANLLTFLTKLDRKAA